MQTNEIAVQRLGQLIGWNERQLRRVVAMAAERQGRLSLENGWIRGEDLPCLLASLHDLQVSFDNDAQPDPVEHFFWMKNQPPERRIVPESWCPPAPAPADSQEEFIQLSEAIAQLRQQVAALERMVLPMHESFTRTHKALEHIGLVLEDEDADNNLYNILVSHIGDFNERISHIEQRMNQMASTFTGGIIKLADDNREIKNLLRKFLEHISPK